MKQDGFALLELLVASVVMAAAGALLVGGMVQVNRSTELHVEQTVLTQLLASQFALLDDALSQQMPASGTCAPPADCTWTLHWIAAPLIPLVETTLTAGWKDRTAHVVTYRPITES